MPDARHLGFLAKALSNEIRRTLDGTIAKDGETPLTGMQRGVLGFVGDRDEDVYQRDIEEHFHIRRSTVTGILQNMERNGWIERVPVAHDARLKKIVPTDKARDNRAQAEVQIERLERKLREGIPDRDIETFRRVVYRMIENLHHAD